MNKIVLLLLICFLSCKSNKAFNQKNDKSITGIKLNAKVSKIDSIGNYFTILVENENDFFKIVSPKKKTNLTGNKIEPGKSYNFRLKQLTNRSQIKSSEIPVPINYLDITRCQNFGLTEICTDSSFELATAYNLIGLYLID